jgi:MPBQ/MSBQ methyltransferase
MSLPAKVPAYFDYLIEAFEQGKAGRFVHLGYWDEPAQPTGTFASAQARLDDLVLEMARIGAGEGVLDVACGFGGTLERINLAKSGMWLAGVNVDPRQLAICRQLRPANRNRLEWQEADACRLPFAANSFDKVVCIEAMFHFSSRREFFLEAARVLKPGGLLVGTDIALKQSARSVPVPGFCIEAPLQDGYGPWPDFWSDDADHAVLAAKAGLRNGTVVDATRNTLPSHRFTASSDTDATRDTGNRALRAAFMLRWLHEAGHLEYSLFKYEKP